MLIRYSSYISHLYNIRRFLYWGVNKYAVRCVYPDLPQDKQTEEDYWYSLSSSPQLSSIYIIFPIFVLFLLSSDFNALGTLFSPMTRGKIAKEMIQVRRLDNIHDQYIDEIFSQSLLLNFSLLLPFFYSFFQGGEFFLLFPILAQFPHLFLCFLFFQF